MSVAAPIYSIGSDVVIMWRGQGQEPPCLLRIGPVLTGDESALTASPSTPTSGAGPGGSTPSLRRQRAEERERTEHKGEKRKKIVAAKTLLPESPGGVERETCPAGHALFTNSAGPELVCDACGAPISKRAVRFSCERCDFDRCVKCLSKEPRREPS
jgi:hypothetical protein